MYPIAPTRDCRLPPQRKAGLALIVGFCSACAFSATDAPPPQPTAVRPHILIRVAEAPVEPSIVTLVPRLLDAQAATNGTDEVRVYLGGLSTFRSGRLDPSNQLALVLLAARDSAGPLLREHRQVVLEVDGHLFMTHVEPDPRLYSYELTNYGYTETVFIPITREMLQRLASAETVRGRLGHWITFDVSARCLGALEDLLAALPEGFSFGALSPTVAEVKHIGF